MFGDPDTGKALSKSEAAKMAGYTEKEVIKALYCRNPRTYQNVQYIEELEGEKIKYKVTKTKPHNEIKSDQGTAIKKGNYGTHQR